MRHFPILDFFLGGGGGGGGVEIIHHDCNLVKNRMEQPPPPPHPPENKDKARESQNMAFIWGEMGWGGGGVNDKFLSILSKNSSSQG